MGLGVEKKLGMEVAPAEVGGRTSVLTGWMFWRGGEAGKVCVQSIRGTILGTKGMGLVGQLQARPLALRPQAEVPVALESGPVRMDVYRGAGG